MNQIMTEQPRRWSKEATTLTATLLLCVFFCLFLSHIIPAQKRVIDFLAQGVFSALLAIPAGVAWRSFQQSRQREVVIDRYDEVVLRAKYQSRFK